ncbi:hypothetical protein AAFP35_22480 [Gordonia sp. CPCC 206044]|uniref:hypothetical protein n=1 Tax=Gordonia sp. CPCC 206044 TaxID=3140793 RepID=UPI003AF3F6A3
MTLPKLRTVLATVTSVIAAGTLIGVAPTAGAAPPARDVQSLRVHGDMEIAPGVHVLRIHAMAVRTAGKTMGWYEATMLDGRNPTAITVRGPITCLYTRGGTASLVYPITGTTPEVLPPGARGAAAVQITVREGVRGGPDHVGVMGPMATSAFVGCNPGATPFVFDGQIAIDEPMMMR